MEKILLSLVMLVPTMLFSNEFDTVDYVDLDKYMIPWYVQGHTPTFLDKGGVNQIESYKLNEKGEVETSFTFFTELGGKKRSFSPKATIYDKETNAHWKMQFLWPFKHDFLVVRLAEDYSYTVISVPNKKMIWIMTDTPEIDGDLYEQIVEDLKDDGYPVESLDRVKQEW